MLKYLVRSNDHLNICQNVYVPLRVQYRKEKDTPSVLNSKRYMKLGLMIIRRAEKVEVYR